MKELWKNAAILFAITMIAGLMLGAVNEVTKEPIRLQKEQKAMEALQQVFLAEEDEKLEGAESFVPVAYDATAMQSVLDEAGYSLERIDQIQMALAKDGKQLGYVFTVTSKEGYGGEITFTMGIRMDGRLNAICLTTINETVGLGMNAEKVLVPQFKGKQVDSFVVTKTGATSDQEVDAITAATYTTNAIVNGVDAGLVAFNNLAEVTK